MTIMVNTDRFETFLSVFDFVFVYIYLLFSFNVMLPVLYWSVSVDMFEGVPPG